MNKKAIFVIVLFIAIVAGGGIYMTRGSGTPEPTPTPVMFVEPTAEPEPTAVVEADISTYKVKILNGTPIAGLAAKTQTALKDAGFTSSSVGNADNKEYQQVVIKAKKSVPSTVIDKIKTAMDKTYTYSSQEVLDDTSEDDIIITLGTKSIPTPTGSQVKPTAVKVSGTPTPTTSTSVTPTVTPTPTKSI